MQLNADIIYLICEKLDPAGVDPFDIRTMRMTLVSFGLTNKICLEPALDVLWREIYSMDALCYFLQMTKDLGTRANVLDSMRNLLSKLSGDNQKAIVKSRMYWNRMLYYTSRVRVLSLYRPGHIDASIYARIGEVPQCIFPNLRQLCASHSLISSGSLPFFLSDSLLSVEFPSSYGEDAPDLGPTLSSVARKVPTLEEIILSYGESRPFSSFSSTLRTLEGLRVLQIYGTLNHYENDFIATISNLPKLSNLSLRVPSATHLNYDGIRKSGFASLKRFLIGASIDEAHAFLSKIPSTVLQSLGVTTWMDPDFLDLPAFLLSFNRLAVKISTFSLLTRCCVELSPVKTALFASDNDLWSTFASFLPLHEIQVFECTFPVCLSDERIESITLAWPNLERLVITPAAAWDILKIDPHTEATINSLSHFAQNCRKLEYLAVPVQVHSPLPDNLPDLTFFAHPLHTFKCTLPGDLVDLNGVAVRLDRVFPSLTHVSGNFRTSAWEEVTRIIREELQVVRAPARVDLGL